MSEIPLFEGIVAGLAAGILMGLMSHAGFRTGIFRSSLFIIDGAFVQNILRLDRDEHKAVIIGIPVHLVTSMSFGIGYAVSANILNIDLLNGWFIALYTLLLWLSMLFMALPTAGQGVLGKKLGALTWLEQIVLHIIFGVGLWGVLHFLP